MLQVGVLHDGRLSLDTVILSVEEESDITGVEDVLVWGVLWNGAIFVVELNVPEAELDGVSV